MKRHIDWETLAPGAGSSNNCRVGIARVRCRALVRRSGAGGVTASHCEQNKFRDRARACTTRHAGALRRTRHRSSIEPPEQFGALIKSEVVKWRKVVRDAG